MSINRIDGMEEFKIEFLDHVALNVRDLEVSASWYEKTLGLRRYKLEKWGEYPVFLLAGKTGLALFPAKLDDPTINPLSNNVKLDHFAFNVSAQNFEKAKRKFEILGIDYIFKDHYYYHSIYAKDPDGHTMELTTLVVDKKTFYKI